MVHRSLRTKRSTTYRTCSVNTVRIFGLNGMQKTFYQKDLHPNIVQTVNLRKKQILWTFGSTPVHLMKLFYYIVKITVALRTFILRVVTNTAVGLTLHYRLLWQ